MEDPMVFTNPSYVDTHTSLQKSHKNEADGEYTDDYVINDYSLQTKNQAKNPDESNTGRESNEPSGLEAIYLELECGVNGYKNSTRLTSAENENTEVKRDGKKFYYIVPCVMIVLLLISVTALTLSLWNTFTLNLSTTEEVSNLMQQSQLTQNQLEEVRNDLLAAVQNLSVHFFTYNNAVNADLNQLNNTLATLENKILNLSTELQYNSVTLNDVSMDLIKVNHTLTVNQDQHSMEISDIYDTFRQNFLPTYSVPECGSGVWRRLAYLNMSDPSQRCPPAWREYTTSVRSCGRPDTNTPECARSWFNTYTYSYSRVCGRIIGYQYGTPEAFRVHPDTVNDHYADGIIVTHGNPETHIWTFVAGRSDNTSHTNACPCANPSADASPSFVGNNYFCESGTTTEPSEGTFYSNDPLWDGEGCVNSQCCTFNSPPWFNVQLSSSTTDDIEVRICGFTDTNNEDMPIELIEIYVQ